MASHGKGIKPTWSGKGEPIKPVGLVGKGKPQKSQKQPIKPAVEQGHEDASLPPAGDEDEAMEDESGMQAEWQLSDKDARIAELEAMLAQAKQVSPQKMVASSGQQAAATRLARQNPTVMVPSAKASMGKSSPIKPMPTQQLAGKGTKDVPTPHLAGKGTKDARIQPSGKGGKEAAVAESLSSTTRLRLQGLPQEWIETGEVEETSRIIALLGKFGELDLSDERWPSLSYLDDGTTAVDATFLQADSATAAMRTLQGADAWVLDELLEGEGGSLDEVISLNVQQLPDENTEYMAEEAEAEPGGDELDEGENHDDAALEWQPEPTQGGGKGKAWKDASLGASQGKGCKPAGKPGKDIEVAGGKNSLGAEPGKGKTKGGKDVEDALGGKGKFGKDGDAGGGKASAGVEYGKGKAKAGKETEDMPAGKGKLGKDGEVAGAKGSPAMGKTKGGKELEDTSGGKGKFGKDGEVAGGKGSPGIEYGKGKAKGGKELEDMSGGKGKAKGGKEVEDMYGGKGSSKAEVGKGKTMPGKDAKGKKPADDAMCKGGKNSDNNSGKGGKPSKSARKEQFTLGVNGEIFGEMEGKGDPVVVFVDELQLLTGTGAPESSPREIYLRGMPVADYTRAELVDWLQLYGKIEDLEILEDQIMSGFSGNGYVRFLTRESAVVLTQSIPEDSGAQTGLRASWSLSEHMSSEANAWLRKAFAKALFNSSTMLQEETPCEAMAFLGDGRAEGRMRLALWLSEATAEGLEAVQTRLTAVLGKAMAQDGAADTDAADEEATWTQDDAMQSAPSAEGDPAWDEGGAADWDMHENSSEEAPTTGVKRKQPEEDESSVEEEETAEAEQTSKPRLFVQGFPGTWNEAAMKRIFEDFGGVKTISFMEDPIGKAAFAELKDPARMAWAVQKINGTAYGDERCHLDSIIVGDNEEEEVMIDRETQANRALFIDELPMPHRPDATPKPQDREVFLQDFPKTIVADADARLWALEFGDVEEVLILKEEVSKRPKGKAYVSFKSHESAAACIAKHSPLEPGTASAVWSESERALQRALNAYRADIQRVFVDSVGYTLPSLISRAKVNSLFMYGQGFNAKGRQPDHVTSPAGKKRLHFCTKCNLDELEELRAALANALEKFHRQVDERLQKLRPTTKTPTTAAPPAKAAQAAPTKVREALAEPEPADQPMDAGDPLASFYAETGQQTVPTNESVTLPKEIYDLLQNAIEESEAYMIEAQSLEESGNADEAYSVYCQGIEHFLKAMQALNGQCADKETLKREVKDHLATATKLAERLRKANIDIASLFRGRQSAPVAKAMADNLAKRSRSRSPRKTLPKAPAKAPTQRAVPKLPGARSAPPAKSQSSISAPAAPTAPAKSQSIINAPAKSQSSIKPSPSISAKTAGADAGSAPGVMPRQPKGPPPTIPGTSPQPPRSSSAATTETPIGAARQQAKQAAAPTPSGRSLAVPKKKALETASTTGAGTGAVIGRKLVTPKSSFI